MQFASQKLTSGPAAYLEAVPQPGARERVIRPTRIQIERELEVLARVMDNQFVIPVLGWRFGLNAIIDLIPGIGDIATSLRSMSSSPLFATGCRRSRCCAWL